MRQEARKSIQTLGAVNTDQHQLFKFSPEVSKAKFRYCNLHQLLWIELATLLGSQRIATNCSMPRCTPFGSGFGKRGGAQRLSLAAFSTLASWNHLVMSCVLLFLVASECLWTSWQSVLSGFKAHVGVFLLESLTFLRPKKLLPSLHVVTGAGLTSICNWVKCCCSF